MKQHRLNGTFDKFSSFAAGVAVAILFAFMLYLAVCAYMETTSVSTLNKAGELAEEYADNVFLNIIILVIILSSLYIFYRHRDDITLKRIEIILMAWVLIFGAAFIVSVKLCAPWYTDSYYVISAAQKAARNDFVPLMDNYFKRFPFQLGFVMYEEMFFRVCNVILPGLPDGYYCLALQGVNLIWLMIAFHALIKLSGHLFYSIRVQKMTALLMIFCMPAVLSCTFIYGNIPAFACGIISLWMFVEFLQRDKIYYALLCAVILAFAVCLKLNLMIFFAAIAIVWVFELLRKFSLRSLLCLVFVAAVVLSVSKAPQKLYEKRCDFDFGSGIPMISWMAMGFSQGDAGPGWYKGEHTVDTFTKSGNDPAATEAHAKQVISERAKYFAENPKEAWKFFSYKLRSQWNEPTYESIWVNKVQASYSEKTGLYNVICTENARVAKELMNQYQQLIFLGVLLSVFAFFGDLEIRNCLPVIVILGGMFYHLLFEAKSQYILPYFIIMIPIAAYGLCSVFLRISNR